MSTEPYAGVPDRERLAGALAGVAPIDLASLTELADLQTRVDHKYLVGLDDFSRLLDRLGPGLQVLEIEERRVFGYSSTYFDTGCLQMYRDHVQGRRRRHKVRVRRYLDSDLTMLEVKAKGGRGETVKHRTTWDPARTGMLGREGRSFVDSFLDGRPRAEDLAPVLVSGYHRATLVDVAAGLRLTCDVDLWFVGEWRPVRVPPGTVLLETKSESGRSVADHHLHRLGHRDTTVSKYCVGVAATTGVPANRWHRTLQRYVGTGPARDGAAGRLGA